MAVSNESIIHKMMQELHHAQLDAENDTKMRQHIEHVKLLCDLVLDESSTMPPQKSEEQTSASAAEMKAMMGHKASVQQPTIHSPGSPVPHDEANGKSIFDF